MLSEKHWLDKNKTSPQKRKLIMRRSSRFEWSAVISEILMLLVSEDQNNFQDNLGIILASISYMITRPGTWLPTNKHSSQTKWSHSQLTAHRSLHYQQLKIPGRQWNRAEPVSPSLRMIFLISAGRIQWKLFIIKPGELQGWLSPAGSCWGDWICLGFDVGLANISLFHLGLSVRRSIKYLVGFKILQLNYWLVCWLQFASVCQFGLFWHPEGVLCQCRVSGFISI